DEFTGFHNCVGFIDGTLFPLYDKPAIDSQDYYSRKGFYGLNTLIVCDDKKQIIYYLTGWPGKLFSNLLTRHPTHHVSDVVATTLASRIIPNSSSKRVTCSHRAST
ncbi:hypothetical protein MJO29_001450, partial [Puccinia striiformis f. sp. tritici]